MYSYIYSIHIYSIDQDNTFTPYIPPFSLSFYRIVPPHGRTGDPDVWPGGCRDWNRPPAIPDTGTDGISEIRAHESDLCLHLSLERGIRHARYQRKIARSCQRRDKTTKLHHHRPDAHCKKHFSFSMGVQMYVCVFVCVCVCEVGGGGLSSG